MKTRKILDITEEISFVFKHEKLLLEVHGYDDIEIEAAQLRDWLTNEVLKDKATSVEIERIARQELDSLITPNPLLAGVDPAVKGPSAVGPIIATKEIIEAQKSARLEDRRAISLGPTELKSYPQLSSKISSSDQFQVHDMSSQVGAKSTEAFSKEGLKKGDA